MFSRIFLLGLLITKDYKRMVVHFHSKKKHLALCLHIWEYFFIEFIGVTLVNKIIQVSDVQVYNASSVYCIVCSPPKSSPHSSPFVPLTLSYLPYPSFPLLIIMLSVSMNLLGFLFLLLLFWFFCLIPVLCIYKSVSILFISLFCSLDSTYK